MDDYFQLFELPQKLSLDAARLKTLYYDLSRKHHPDFYQKKSPKKRLAATEKTSLLNKAYEILRDPFRRAEYVLSLAGQDVKKDLPVSPDLLAEVFEIQENLEREGTPRATLEEEAAHLKERIQKLHGQLEAISREWDTSRTKEEKTPPAEKVLRILHEKKYIDSILRNVETHLGRHCEKPGHRD